MVFHRAVRKGLGEVGLVNVVVVEHANEDWEIIVAVCLMDEVFPDFK